MRAWVLSNKDFCEQLWLYAQDLLFMGSCTGLAIIVGASMRWCWYGMLLAFVTWAVWVGAYDLADGFRNVNQ
jgi:hypothetical protein